MKLPITKSLLIAATLALGFNGRAFAQSASTPAATPAPASSSDYNAGPDGIGLLGSRYVGLDYGYLRYDRPNNRSGHEFAADYNQPILPGLDFTATAEDTTTGYFHKQPREEQLLAGLTAYQAINPWMKPFISGQIGASFSRDTDLIAGSGLFTSHSHRRYFHQNLDWIASTGVEFQVLPRLVVTPTISYQEVRQYFHDWDFGVKATYRLTRHWDVSVMPQIDEHKNLGYDGGVNWHF